MPGGIPPRSIPGGISPPPPGIAGTFNLGTIREKFPKIPRAVSGYNLPYLLPENGFHVARALVGTESTCVLVLEAKARLVESPAEDASSVASAGHATCSGSV